MAESRSTGISEQLSPENQKLASDLLENLEDKKRLEKVRELGQRPAENVVTIEGYRKPLEHATNALGGGYSREVLRDGRVIQIHVEGVEEQLEAIPPVDTLRVINRAIEEFYDKEVRRNNSMLGFEESDIRRTSDKSEVLDFLWNRQQQAFEAVIDQALRSRDLAQLDDAGDFLHDSLHHHRQRTEQRYQDDAGKKRQVWQFKVDELKRNFIATGGREEDFTAPEPPFELRILPLAERAREGSLENSPEFRLAQLIDNINRYQSIDTREDIIDELTSELSNSSLPEAERKHLGWRRNALIAIQYRLRSPMTPEQAELQTKPLELAHQSFSETIRSGDALEFLNETIQRQRLVEQELNQLNQELSEIPDDEDSDAAKQKRAALQLKIADARSRFSAAKLAAETVEADYKAVVQNRNSIIVNSVRLIDERPDYYAAIWLARSEIRQIIDSPTASDTQKREAARAINRLSELKKEADETSIDTIEELAANIKLGTGAEFSLRPIFEDEVSVSNQKLLEGLINSLEGVMGVQGHSPEWLSASQVLAAADIIMENPENYGLSERKLKRSGLKDRYDKAKYHTQGKVNIRPDGYEIKLAPSQLSEAIATGDIAFFTKQIDQEKATIARIQSQINMYQEAGRSIDPGWEQAIIQSNQRINDLNIWAEQIYDVMRATLLDRKRQATEKNRSLGSRILRRS